jgi:hypothetical protein
VSPLSSRKRLSGAPLASAERIDFNSDPTALELISRSRVIVTLDELMFRLEVAVLASALRTR